MQQKRAALQYVSALCIYGTIGWAVAYINLPSEVVVLCRGILGTLVVFAVLMITKGRFDMAPVRQNLRWLVASGMCLGFNWVLLFASYRFTTVAVASLVNYMAPIAMILAAPALLGERLSYKKTACAAVAVLGVMMVSGVFTGGAEGVSATGVALAAGAALGFFGMVLCNKKCGPVPVYEKTVVQLASSVAITLPFVLVNNWGVALHPDALSVGLVIMLGVVHTGFAYCLYFGALGHLSAQTIAVLGYIEPAVAVLVSAFALHEPLSALGWLGAALIIGAATASEVVE